MQRQLHIQGRYGITIFAWSGIEMALWDAAAKRTGVSLATLLGGRRRGSVPAYASLVRYGGAREVRDVCAKAIADGYRDVKLHEIAYEPIAAGREAVGRDVRLTTDVNCNWSLAETEVHAAQDEGARPLLGRGADLAARGFRDPGAAGGAVRRRARRRRECLHRVPVPGPHPRRHLRAAERHQDRRHPRVHEGGGRRAPGRQAVMPHSPYFGPGWWATLQLAAHAPEIGLIEYLYIESEGEVGKNIPLPKKGTIQIPDTPGLGFEPDFDAIDKFRVG